MLVLSLLVCVGFATQLVRDPSFEDVNASSASPSAWLPFLSGFYRSESQCRTGDRCLSVTPHHFFGAWQHIPIEGYKKSKLLALSAYVNGEWVRSLACT
jgi:hypothetical protein